MLLGKIKIYEIAKKLDLTSKEVLEMAQKLNMDVKSHMSGVDEEEAKKIENSFSKNQKQEQQAKQKQDVKEKQPAKQEQIAKATTAPKKEEKAPVIIRREVIVTDEENDKKHEDKKQENRNSNIGFVERKQNKDFNIVYRNKPNKPKTVNELFGLNKPESKKEPVKEEIKEQGDNSAKMQTETAVV